MSGNGLKLDFNNNRLHGRASALSDLNSVFDRVVSNGEAIVVGIRGSSGTGKSFLLETWKHEKEEQNPSTIFVSSKFDQVKQTCAPYSTISHILGQLCEAVINADGDGSRQELNEIVHDAIGEETSILLSTLPSLVDYLTPDLSSLLKHPQPTQQPQQGDGPTRCASNSSLDGGFFVPCFNNTFNNTAAFNRFAFIFGQAFRRICNFLASASKNACLLFDDIQYSDQNSKQIIQLIAADHQLRHCLFLLTFHDNWDQCDSFRQLMRTKAQEKLHQKNENAASTDTANYYYRDIHLQNLSVDDATSIISEVTLHRNTEECRSLAQLACEKTGGNPFFLLQYLHILKQRQLLKFSYLTFKWEWDLELVRQKTELTDNIAEVVKESVKNAILHDGDRRLLEIASYLGASFHIEDVSFVQQKMDALMDNGAPTNQTASILEVVNAISATELQTTTQNNVESVFQKAVEERLLIYIGGDEYKFAHDSIQKHFFAHHEQNDSSSKLLMMGAAILALSKSTRLKEMLIFAAMEVFNIFCANQQVLDDPSRWFLVKLSMQVATLAIHKSAFFPAKSYLESAYNLTTTSTRSSQQNGQEQPCSSCWETHYAVMHRLSRNLIEVELACGQTEQASKLAKQLATRSRETNDKIASCFSLALSLRAQDKMKESYKILMDGLKLMGGETFPKKPRKIHVILSSRRTRKLMQKRSIDSIFVLPEMKDRNMQTKMKFLCMLLISAYNLSHDAGYTEAFRLVSMRMVVLTLRYGLCKFSPLAFAAHAYKLVGDKRYEEAYTFGELSNKLIDKLDGAKETLPLMTFFLTTFVNHLHQPMHQSLKRLMKGFQVGMESGLIEWGFMCASTSVAYQFVVACPLASILEESRRCYFSCRQYNRDKMAGEFLLVSQLVANLTGKSDDPIAFDGKFVNAEDLMSELKSEKGTKGYYLYQSLICAAFMGDWDKALTDLTALRDPERQNKLHTSHYSYITSHTYSGLVYLKAYERSNNPKYKKLATYSMDYLKKWVENGAINIPPNLWFLQAQMKMAERRSGFQETKIMFDKAISGLHRCGFRHFEALACEHLAEFALENGEKEWAIFYCRRVRFYLFFAQLPKSHMLLAHSLITKTTNRRLEYTRNGVH